MFYPSKSGVHKPVGGGAFLSVDLAGYSWRSLSFSGVVLVLQIFPDLKEKKSLEALVRDHVVRKGCQ